MVREEQSPRTQQRDSNPVEIRNGSSLMFSPRFKSVAAIAGWDEDSLLMASLIVDDTPEQDIKSKKRSVFRSKTPPTNSSRRKRRAQRKSPISISVAVLDLDSEEATKEESVKENINEEDEKMDKSSDASGSSSKLPCMDKLRDELSCAVRASFCNVMGLCFGQICLEICFEPSTTPCGHSFCKKCL